MSRKTQLPSPHTKREYAWRARATAFTAYLLRMSYVSDNDRASPPLPLMPFLTWDGLPRRSLARA